MTRVAFDVVNRNPEARCVATRDLDEFWSDVKACYRRSASSKAVRQTTWAAGKIEYR